MQEIGGAMARKGYNEGCLAAHALDLIGDRWALLVLRELMLGPKRFGALQAGLPGIATNVLTQRLADLERTGLLTRRTLPPPASVQVYDLTPAGRDTRGIIDALCVWGVRQPGHDPRKFISPTALLLSMAVMVAPPAQGETRVAMVMGPDCFLTRLSPAGFVPRPCADGPPAGTLTLVAPNANAMAATVYGPAPLAQSINEGRVTLDGDPDHAQRFLDAFALRR
ncbi:MAG TPA: helix-turn-helix domain-containing protein [Pararhodobacter sp.]|uniref:winged helix-turn-helix transcriptional regulator n=1 Tax=Pararhodobacter sp. TaxID=2127056 RepID=UPI002B808969|nr:helix-turn-helix domain-containing protein [Pararhodobacter sp.]HPD93041.1 helix-turn-helix domain-containing protein [Pararhodobacter sp.]